MQAEHIRLDAKQIVATAIAQGMITQAQADIVMAHAADYERRGVDHLNVLDLMVSLNLVTRSQAAQLKTIAEQAPSQETFSIGKYLLTNRLGAGAMGTVYLAVDQTLQRKVALKVLSPQLAALPEFVARFKREARMTAQLSHRNIVHVHDVDELDGFLFYAMEYLEGQGLDDLIKKKGKLPPGEALNYAIQAARGLEAAHKINIIHRDVKPANLFLGKDGTIKLVDLGLSKDTSDAKASEASMTGMAIGTPHYIAPEQARGLEGIDGRADIYGLGCTLYTLITGTTPYSGPNPLAIMNKQINEPPPDPRSVVSSLPAAFTVLIELMMAKNPNDRYQSCTELIADLERVQAGKAPMGASVAVDDAGATDGDVPALKRRPVGGKRGSSGPITGIGRGARPASALLLESPRGDSSALRRASAVTGVRRGTVKLPRAVEPAVADEEVDNEESELPAWKRMPLELWQDRLLPLWQKYPVQLGVAGGVLGVILLIVLVNMMLPGPVPRHKDEIYRSTPRPLPTTPPAPTPSLPAGNAPGTPTPPPTPAATSPAVTSPPANLSPYELYQRTHRKPTPTATPTTPPTTPPSPPSPPPPIAGKPASYTPPPKGYRSVQFFDGHARGPQLGNWHRVAETQAEGLTYLHFVGNQIGATTDIQWPFFLFDSHFDMSGDYMVRCRLRRNNKETKNLRVAFFTGDVASSRVASFDFGPDSTNPQGWVVLEATASCPAAEVRQFELRANGVGMMGETIDVEWFEIAIRTDGASATVAPPPAASALTHHTPAAGAVLHLDGAALVENQVQWVRCTSESEGDTGFVRWVFAGHLAGDGRILSPSVALKNAFRWTTTTRFTIRLRMRGRGQPRFNCGLKFYYGNERNPDLVSTGRLDFTRQEWGEWQVKAVTIDVGVDAQFNELEIRPYEAQSDGGSIDIDWLEIVPAAP